MSQGCPGIWQDLTDSHRQIREQLERAIIDYVNGKCKEEGGCYAPIIVAPYGSGKTTLLRHLLCFSIRNGIPAVLVNLSRLVNYLKNKVGNKITEDSLPGRVAIFCNDVIDDIIKGKKKEEYNEYFEHVKDCCVNDQELIDVLSKYSSNNYTKCILLLDEIEEAYNDFKGLISYGTTPFRGLFDSIKRGVSRVFAVMAFGPSSIYSEVASLSSTWRTRTFIIPLITPLEVPVEGIEDELRPYIANLVWWIGKGRAGHVWEKVAKSVNIGSINTELNEMVKLTEVGSTDPIETLMSSIDQVLGSLKGVKLTEGTPYIDFKVYRELLTEVYKKGNKDLLKLFALLTLLIGPVPQSILERYLSKESIDNIIKLRIGRYIVKSNEVFEVNDVISKIMEWLGSDDPFIADLLRNVMLAWSNHEVLLLDVDTLNDLFDIIKALSIEMYKPEIYDLFNRIDIKALHNELEKFAKKSDEYYFALRPSVIEQLYPPIILTPLIGCSKDKEIADVRNELSKKIKVEEVLRFSEELLREMYGNQKLDFMFAVVPSTLMDEMKEPLLMKLMSSGTNKLLLLPIHVEESLDTVIKNLEDRWNNYISYGIAKIINPGEKLSLFIMGKLYNQVINCQRQLDKIELNLSSQYINALKRLIEEASHIVRGELLNEELTYKAKYLKEWAGRAVGSAQAEYVWLFSSSPHAEIIKDYLIGAVEIIDDVKRHYAEAFNVSEDYLKNTLLKDISLIINEVRERLKEDRGYIKDSINLWNEVNEKVRNTPAFEILRELVLIKLKELKDTTWESIRDLVKNGIYPSLRNILDVREEPLGYMLVWSVLNSLSEEELSRVNVLDKLLNILSRLASELNKDKDKVMKEEILKQLKDKLMEIHELRENIYDVIKTINDENLRERAKESYLMRLIDDYESKLSKLENSIRELDNKYYDEIYNNEIKAQISDLTIFEKILILEFIYNEILNVFLENVGDAIKDSSELSELKDAISCVNAVRGGIIDILQYKLDNSTESGAVRAVIEDFLQILYEPYGLSDFKNNCYKNLIKDIDKLKEILLDNVNVLEYLKKMHERILWLRNKLESVDSYGEKH